MFVDGGATDIRVNVLELELLALGDDLEHPECFQHNFGPDVITGEDGNLDWRQREGVC